MQVPAKSDILKALRVPRYGGIRMERKKRTLLKLSFVEGKMAT